MTTLLNDTQLLALLQAGKALDGVKPSLPAEVQIELFKLEQRAGNAYASGNWQTQNGQTFNVPLAMIPPTVEDAQSALGHAYLALQDQQTTVKNVMNEMGLNPSAQKSWMGQIGNMVSGWFR